MKEIRNKIRIIIVQNKQNKTIIELYIDDFKITQSYCRLRFLLVLVIKIFKWFKFLSGFSRIA